MWIMPTTSLFAAIVLSPTRRASLASFVLGPDELYDCVMGGVWVSSLDFQRDVILFLAALRAPYSAPFNLSFYFRE